MFFFAYRISWCFCNIGVYDVLVRVHVRCSLHSHSLRFHFSLFHLYEISFLVDAPFAISINDRPTDLHVYERTTHTNMNQRKYI